MAASPPSPAQVLPGSLPPEMEASPVTPPSGDSPTGLAITTNGGNYVSAAGPATRTSGLLAGASPPSSHGRQFSIDLNRSLPRNGTLTRGSSSLPRTGSGGTPVTVQRGASSLQPGALPSHRLSGALSSITSQFSSSLPRALSGVLQSPLPNEAEQLLSREYAELENRNAVLTQWVDDLQRQNQQLQEAQEATENEMEVVKKQLKAVKDQAEADQKEWSLKLSDMEEKLTKAGRKLEDKEAEIRGLNYEIEEVKKNRDALAAQKRQVSQRYAELEVRATTQAMALREAGLEVIPPPNFGGPGQQEPGADGSSTPKTPRLPAESPALPMPTKKPLADESPMMDSPNSAQSAFKLKQSMFASLPSGIALSSLGVIPNVDLSRPRDDMDTLPRPSTPSVDPSRDSKYMSLGRSFSVDAIRARALKAESELAQAQQSLSTALERADTLEDALRKRTAERDDLTRQLRSWKGELADLLRTVEDLERNLKATREQDGKSRAEVEEMHRQVIRREGELEQERENIEQLSRVLSLLERQSENAEKEIEELQSKVTYLRSRNVAYKQRLANSRSKPGGDGLETAGFQTFTSVASLGFGSDDELNSETSSALERSRAESLAPFVEELRKTQSELVTAHKQVVEKEDELRAIRLERTNLRTQLKDKEKARRELESQLEDTKKKLETVEGDLQQLQRGGSESGSPDLAKLEQEVDQLRKLVTVKDQQIESIMREARDQLKAIMDNPDKDLPDIPESVVSSAAQSFLAPPPVPARSLSSGSASMEAEMARLTTALNEVEAARRAREAEALAAQAKLAEVQQSLEALQNQQQQSASSVPPSGGVSDAEIESLRNDIAVAETELQQSRLRIAALEGQLAETNARYAQQIAALTQQLGEAQKQRDSHAAELVALAAVSRSLEGKEAEVVELNAKLSGLERAAFEAQKLSEGRIAELQSQLRQLASHTFSRSMGRSPAGPGTSDFAQMASMTMGNPASKNIEMEREIAALKAERTALQARIARGEAEDKIVMAKMMELDKAGSAAVAKATTLAKQLQELKAKSDSEKLESTKALAAAEERIVALQRAAKEQQVATERMLKEAQAREDALVRNAADLQRSAQSIPAANSPNLADEKKKAEARVAELVAALALAEKADKGSKQRIAELQIQLNGLSQARSQDQAKLAELSEQLNQSRRETQSALQASAQAATAEQQKVVDNLTAQLREMQSQTKELERVTSEQQAAAMAKISELSAQLEQARQELRAAQEASEAAQLAAEAARKEAAAAKDPQLTYQAASIPSARSTPVSDDPMDELQRTLDELNLKCDSLQKSEASLRSQLAELQGGGAALFAIPAVVALKTQLQGREQELARTQSAAQSAATASAAEQEKLRKELTEIHGRLGEAETVLKGRDREIETLKQAVAGSEDLKRELQALQIKLDQGTFAMNEERRKAAEALTLATVAKDAELAEERKKTQEATAAAIKANEAALAEEKRKTAEAVAAATAAVRLVSSSSQSDALVTKLNAQIADLQSKLDQESSNRKQEGALFKGQLDAYQRQIAQNSAAAAQAGSLATEVAALKRTLESKQQQHNRLQDLFLQERQRRRTSNELLKSLQAELENVKRRLEDMDDAEEAQLAKTLSKLQEKHEALRRAAESAGDFTKVMEDLAAESEAEARKADSATAGTVAAKPPMANNSFMPSKPAAAAVVAAAVVQQQQQQQQLPPFAKPAAQQPPPLKVELPRSVPYSKPALPKMTSSSATAAAVAATKAAGTPMNGSIAQSSVSSALAPPPKAPVPAPGGLRMGSNTSIGSPAPDSPLSSFSSYLGSPVGPQPPRISVPANQPQAPPPQQQKTPLPPSRQTKPAPAAAQMSYQPQTYSTPAPQQPMFPPYAATATGSQYAKAPLPTKKPSLKTT